MTRATPVVLLGLVLAACGGDPPPPAAATTAATPPKAAYFTVPADQLPHIGLVTARKTSWSATLRTTGTVDWNNDHTTQAITQVSGPIARIVVDAGARVKAGDPLLYVASPDISNALSAYRKARNRLTLAQRTLDRSRDLFAHKAIAARDVESVEADFNDAGTDLENALQALKIFGLSPQDIQDAERQNQPIRPELPMHASIAGTVVQKLVLPGQFIQAGTTVAFVISNVSTVWVQGHVYDKDLTRVHVGDPVDARNSSFDETFHGVVSYIGDAIDPATRTTPVRIVTENQRSLLKKDLFVDIVIHDRARHDVLAVPTAAVLYDEQNLPFVYVQVQPGAFAQRLVTLGSQQGDETQVAEGLKDGDTVVAQGSVFLQFANASQP